MKVVGEKWQQLKLFCRGSWWLMKDRRSTRGERRSGKKKGKKCEVESQRKGEW